MLVLYSQFAYLCTIKLINNYQSAKKTMEKNYSEDAPIRTVVREMEVGDLIHFPAARLSVVRTTTSILSVELSRKYRSRVNRKMMTIDVTRLA